MNSLITAGVAVIMTIAIFAKMKRSSLTASTGASKSHANIEAEVRERFQSRKLGQKGWIAVEVCDFISDFGAFSSYTAVCALTENYDALFYSYLLLVIVTVPAFVNNAAVRLKIVSQYNNVLDNGETVAAYANVLYSLKLEEGAIQKMICKLVSTTSHCVWS